MHSDVTWEHVLSNHQLLVNLCNSFHGLTIKKTPLCKGNPLVTSGFPHKMWKAFQCHNVITRRKPNGWKSISMSRNFKCYKSHFTVSILVYLTFYGLWYTVKQVSFTRYRQTCILLTFIDFKTYYRPLPVCLFTLVAKAVTTVTVSGHRACDTPPPSKTLVTHECTRTATPWQTGRSMNWWASSPTHHWSQLKVPLELSPSNITLTKIVALMRPKHSKN